VGLTSPVLPFLLASLAVGTLLAIIVDWRAMAGRNLRSVLHRAISVVGLQFFVLAFIFVVVNRSGEFYDSWSDLFGLDNSSGAVIASTVTGSSRVQPVIVASRTPVPVPGSKTSGGVLETVTFNGQNSGLSAGGEVFLPARYQPGNRLRRYPVVVEISNNLMSTSSPYAGMRFAEAAARQIALGQLEPVIIVMLPATVGSTGQGCVDIAPQQAAGSAQPAPPIMAATFFTQDIPAILESQYAASNSSANWGLLADSSGGYCALQLAMTNSWAFTAAVVPDGAYSRPPGSAGAGSSPQLKLQENLEWLLRNQPMQPVSVLFTRSGLSTGAARLFQAEATRPMRVSTTTIGGGGWPLAPVLNWIGAAIATRAAHGSETVSR
jgi:hypothetical protein